MRSCVSTGGLHHVNIRAPDSLIEDLRVFYCEVLGLEVGSRPPFASRGYWLYAGGRDILHLSVVESSESEATKRSTGHLDHIALACTGLEAMLERLASRGIPYRADHVPALGQTQLFIEDPSGLRVELNFSAIPDA